MDAYLNEVVHYLAAQSWQIAMLTAAVAAVTFALRHRSAHIRYLLWLIVIAKCLVPPLHAVPLRVLPPAASGAIHSVSPRPVDGGQLPIIPNPASFSTLGSPLPESPAPPPALPTGVRRLSASGWLGVTWIIGAGVYLLMNLLRASRGHSWLRKARRPLPEDVQADTANLLLAYGVRHLPKIWIMEGVGQPFVWGLLRGSIYVPPDFLSIESPKYRRDILAHELSHVLRFDAAVNVLQVIAQGLFWFHPFVWWANRKICQEREKCCDEMVIARLHTTPKDYSTAIVETLARAGEPARPVPSLAVASPLKHIEARINTILRPGKRFYRRPGFVAAGLVILAALVTIPTAVVPAPQSKHLVSGTIHIAPTEPGIWDSEPKQFDRNTYVVFMRTQAVLILSNESVLKAVADDLARRGLTFFSSPSNRRASQDSGPQGAERVLRQAIAKGIIKAAPVPDTELLEVTMTGENEEEAKTIVNSFLEHYVTACRREQADKMDADIRKPGGEASRASQDNHGGAAHQRRGQRRWRDRH